MKKLFQNRSGQGLTEYLILLLLISIISITAVKALGGVIRSKINQAKEQISGRVVTRGSDSSEGIDGE